MCGVRRDGYILYLHVSEMISSYDLGKAMSTLSRPRRKRLTLPPRFYYIRLVNACIDTNILILTILAAVLPSAEINAGRIDQVREHATDPKALP